MSGVLAPSRAWWTCTRPSFHTYVTSSSSDDTARDRDEEAGDGCMSLAGGAPCEASWNTPECECERVLLGVKARRLGPLASWIRCDGRQLWLL